jgi:hypothetical protein
MRHGLLEARRQKIAKKFAREAEAKSWRTELRPSEPQ